MIVDRSEGVVVKPFPRYPDYERNGGGILPGEGINRMLFPPAVTQIAPPQITPVVPVPNGGAAPTPGAGFPTWAKIGIGVVGVLFLIGGVRA